MRTSIHQRGSSVPEADFQTLSIERRDSGVALLTLDRPSAANTISAQLSRELFDCLQLSGATRRYVRWW